MQDNSIHRSNIIVYVVAVLITSNLYALTDLLLQPEISYFSRDHVAFGSLVILFGAVLGYIILSYEKQAHKFREEKVKLLRELHLSKMKTDEDEKLNWAGLDNLSHEIHTAMSGIISFSQLLKDPKLSDDKQKVSADMIATSGERMLYILNELLEMLRIDSGTMKLYRSGVNINEQLDVVVEKFHPEAKKKGLKMVLYKTLSDSEATVNLDGGKLRSILTHLVHNAVKYTAKGSVELGYEIKVLFGGMDTVLDIYVQDTGVGVPDHMRETIFERFGQQDTEANPSGMGLGLSIARAYAELMGGKIWLESGESAGVTFWLRLPYEGEFQPRPVKKKVTESNRGRLPVIKGLKILIVEDDEISEKYLTEILDKSLNQIFVAHSGVVAVQMCRNTPDLDLILMDIKMPEMDGLEATRRIREFNKDVIIFAQTAYALPGDKKKAMKLGCNEYLTKPVMKKDLLKLIRQYIKS